MNEKSGGSKFADRLREHCRKEAQSFREWILETVSSSDFEDEAERTAALEFFLEDELCHFYFRTLKLHTSDSEGAKKFRSAVARGAGRSSGNSRSLKSTKHAFLLWAVEEIKRNPAISKNQLAKRFADQNPGTFLPTLRRYIAESGLGGDD